MGETKKLCHMGAAAKAAARQLAVLGTEKDQALREAAKGLRSSTAEILSANGQDVAAARESGMAESKIDRLLLTEARIADMASALEALAAEKDPVGRVLDGGRRPNGLLIERVTVPLGVIGIIYEARPNVTSDAAGLCVKAGNAVILRGGKEAIRANKAIVAVLRAAFSAQGLPADSVQLVTDTSRESAAELMNLTDFLDVLIPRGSAALIQSVKKNARVPVIETGVGNCHVFVDASADLDMAVEIIDNGKTSRPSVCNAVETVLVHEAIAEQALPLIANRLLSKQVELRGDAKTCALVPACKPATEADWETEYSDKVLALKVVPDYEAAVAHISQYATNHSETIVTRDTQNGERFLREVDSAAVYVNASTRFTDGGAFGLGAEIGISTQKLHARGPMGLEQLTSYKFLIRGDGQVR